MKAIFSFVVSMLLVISGFTQNPVSWAFTSKKVTSKTYEVHITGTILKGWHLYAQIQGTDAIAVPTEISFNNNPLVQLTGLVKEEGKLEKYEDKTLGITANQYSRQITFVQQLKLKMTVRTNITGSITYQACTEEKCMPPKTVSFNVSIQ